jgi:hypothetical protein
MEDFKLGDEVRVLEKAIDGNVEIGTVGFVTLLDADGTVGVGGSFGNWFYGGNGGNLELVKPETVYPNTPHVHQKEIKAWADGADIQWYSNTTEKWNVTNEPLWCTKTKYRVKPAHDPRLSELNEKLVKLYKKIDAIYKEIGEL